MEDPRLTALELIRKDRLYKDKLWLSYWANGGSVGLAYFEAHLRGLSSSGDFDLQILHW